MQPSSLNSFHVRLVTKYAERFGTSGRSLIGWPGAPWPSRPEDSRTAGCSVGGEAGTSSLRSLPFLRPNI